MPEVIVFVQGIGVQVEPECEEVMREEADEEHWKKHFVSCIAAKYSVLLSEFFIMKPRLVLVYAYYDTFITKSRT